MAVGIRSATVAEEVHHLVSRLLVGGQVVPEHSRIFEVGLRVSLLRVDEKRELGWVAKEEDRGVVEHPVPVALLRVEFDGESTGVTSAVSRTLLTTDGGETRDELRLLAHTLEHINDSLSKYSQPLPFLVCWQGFQPTMSLISSVTSNSPYAPAPLAWTTRSGIRSLSKWASKSIKWKSCSRRGPLGPTRWEASGSKT